MLLLKKAPFIKPVIPLITGILLQWEFGFSARLLISILLFSLFTLLIAFFLKPAALFSLKWVNGALVFIMVFSAGCLLTHEKNIKNEKNWFGNRLKTGQTLIIRLEEPLSEKPNSFKAVCSVTGLITDSSQVPVLGKMIVYFKKDATIPSLRYSSVLMFSRPVQPIQNTGNPGAFDYIRYSLFRGITHQVYLTEEDYVVLPERKNGFLQPFLLHTRNKVISLIKKYIPGRREQGLAEAILIGYKDDLDKTLIRSYSNTGVVHIIAISGLHLGIIYGILILLLSPLKKTRSFAWIRPLLILGCLWLFSLLAGGSPSVVRSAVMFSCIILGEALNRKASVYNTLALSAFVLLSYNPFWLWDIGFQLSYAAVLSIVTFFRPVYNWFYIKNRLLDLFWKINAVTITAQLLTLPLSVYHFHRFPNYFLLTNFVAVPFSSLILTGEILICACGFFPLIAETTGRTVSFLIRIMNAWVERIDGLPFSTWENLQVNGLQVILLFFLLTGFSLWLMEKVNKALIAGLVALLFFISVRSITLYPLLRQNKVIVYQIPKHTAIDLISSGRYRFIGDSDIQTDPVLQQYHLQPSRIMNRAHQESFKTDPAVNRFFLFAGKRIAVLGSGLNPPSPGKKVKVDLLILVRNPGKSLSGLARILDISQVVFDASFPRYKLDTWKKECEALEIPWYDVREKGAFVMSMN